MKDVPEFEEYFSVTEDGKVWSKRSNKFLKTRSVNGYLGFTTRIGGRTAKGILLKVHRLVALTYIPNPDNKPQVNHKDGNKLNNHVSNLEWSTASENIQHAYTAGLAKGMSGCANVFSEEDIKYIRNSYIPYDPEFGTRGLSRRFNVDHMQISRIVNNKTYKNIK